MSLILPLSPTTARPEWRQPPSHRPGEDLIPRPSPAERPLMVRAQAVVDIIFHLGWNRSRRCCLACKSTAGGDVSMSHENTGLLPRCVVAPSCPYSPTPRRYINSPISPLCLPLHLLNYPAESNVSWTKKPYNLISCLGPRGQILAGTS